MRTRTQNLVLIVTLVIVDAAMILAGWSLAYNCTHRRRHSALSPYRKL